MAVLCVFMASSSVLAAPCINIDTTKPFSDIQIITGNFDTQGVACINVNFAKASYIQGQAEGIRKLTVTQLPHYQRDLFDNSVPTAQQPFGFALADTGEYQFNFQGKPSDKWKLALTFKTYQPLQIVYQQNIESPRLQQLAEEINSGNSTESFWREMKINGTPLIENYDDKHRRVTFIWREAKANAYILGSPNGDHDPMARLGKSDVWYRSYIVPIDTIMQYQIAPDIPKIETTDKREQRRAIIMTAQSDPYNPHQVSEIGKDIFNSYSLLALTNNRVCDFPELFNRNLMGSLTLSLFNSEILRNTREIAVYSPPMKMDKPALLVLFDGQTYRKNYAVDRLLDKLISEGKIPPMYVVMIDSINSQQRAQELPPNDDFPRFLDTELLPWLAQQGIQVAPERTIISGSSYGGLASTWNAMKLPHRFGNVLSMSGSYWWAPKDEQPEWLIREFASTNKLPIKFFLEAGLFESQKENEGILYNNRHFNTVLKEKGYEVQQLELSSGHDYVSWCETLYKGTVALTETW